MGEAKRRQEAREASYANGTVWKPDRQRCPVCRSERVRRFSAADVPALAAHFDCDVAGCGQCGVFWEPFPAEGYVLDPVCAEPCDNCAFRPGSPEQENRAAWRELLDKIRPNSEGWFSGKFYCHKGVPIDLAKGPGNFLFPVRPIREGERAPEADGKPGMTWDIAKMRICSGFLRVFWAMAEKTERPVTYEQNVAAAALACEAAHQPPGWRCCASCGTPADCTGAGRCAIDQAIADGTVDARGIECVAPLADEPV